MAIQKKNAFSRRVPDLVTEELVSVLSSKGSFEFKQLFEVVHENLRARNAASGGEEMLRLRAYEKLQNLVARGVVKKNGKKQQQGHRRDEGAHARSTRCRTGWMQSELRRTPRMPMGTPPVWIGITHCLPEAPPRPATPPSPFRRPSISQGSRFLSRQSPYSCCPAACSDGSSGRRLR